MIKSTGSLTTVRNTEGIRGTKEVVSQSRNLATVADCDGTIVSVRVVVARLLIVFKL